MVIATYKTTAGKKLAGVFPSWEDFLKVAHVLENTAWQKDTPLESLETNDSLEGLLMRIGVNIHH